MKIDHPTVMYRGKQTNYISTLARSIVYILKYIAVGGIIGYISFRIYVAYDEYAMPPIGGIAWINKIVGLAVNMPTSIMIILFVLPVLTLVLSLYVKARLIRRVLVVFSVLVEASAVFFYSVAIGIPVRFVHYF